MSAICPRRSTAGNKQYPIDWTTLDMEQYPISLSPHSINSNWPVFTWYLRRGQKGPELFLKLFRELDYFLTQIICMHGNIHLKHELVLASIRVGAFVNTFVYKVIENANISDVDNVYNGFHLASTLKRCKRVPQLGRCVKLSNCLKFSFHQLHLAYVYSTLQSYSGK